MMVVVEWRVSWLENKIFLCFCKFSVFFFYYLCDLWRVLVIKCFQLGIHNFYESIFFFIFGWRMDNKTGYKLLVNENFYSGRHFNTYTYAIFLGLLLIIYLRIRKIKEISTFVVDILHISKILFVLCTHYWRQTRGNIYINFEYIRASFNKSLDL